MQKYRYKGVEVEAESPEEAKAIVRSQMGTSATEGMSAFDTLMAGAGSGMVNVGRQVGNMLGFDSIGDFDTSDAAIERQKQLDEELLESGWGQGGRMLGEVAATAPLGVGTAAAAGRVLPRAMAGIGGLMTEGATEGAILGGPDGRASGAAGGAAFGGGLGLLGKAGGRMMRGMNIDPAAQKLLDEGIDLTPGQMNRGGVMDVLEQSAPGRFSAGTQAARGGAQDQMFEVMARRATPPGMNPAEVAGEATDMVRKLRMGFKAAYANVPDVPVPRMAPGGKGTLDDAIVRMVRSAPGVKADDANALASWVANEFSSLPKGVAVSAHDLMKVRSRVRSRMAQAYKAGDLQMGEALTDVAQTITDQLNKALPPEAQQLLRATDAKYGAYKVIEDAANRAGDFDMTPFKMSQAVKQSAGSKGLYAEGGGRMRDLTSAGAKAFKQSVPPTGLANALPMATAGLGAMVGGAPGAMAGVALPSTLVALGSGTKAGRRAFRGDLAGQRLLDKAVKSYRRGGGDSLNAAARALGIHQMNEDR